MSWRRATSAYRTPGSIASRMIRSFSSSDQRRRRSGRVSTSIRIRHLRKYRYYYRNQRRYLTDREHPKKAASSGRLRGDPE